MCRGQNWKKRSCMAMPVRLRHGESPVYVFLLVFTVYAYFMPRWADWNQDSRMDLVHAIVSDHSLRIDRTHWNTWDKAQVGNHFYSDKAPGTALLGAGVLAVFVALNQAPPTHQIFRAIEGNSAWNVAVRLGKTNTQAAPAAKGRILGGCRRAGIQGNVQFIPWGNRLFPPLQEWAFTKYLVTAATVALPSALFMSFFFWFLALFIGSLLIRWLMTGLYAIGTAALPYSTVFYSHQLAAAGLFTAFALMYLAKRRGSRGWWALTAGFLLGFSFFTEFTVIFVAVILGFYGLYVFRRDARRTAAFIAAGLVPVAGVLLYNKICFGSALDTGYAHDFCWSSAQSAGFAGFTYPHLGPLWDLTLGSYRGLFFMSPFLLLAVPGVFSMVRRKMTIESVICLVAGLGFIILLSAYWGWNGGQVDGPRYLVPIIPFLVFPAALFVDSTARDLRAKAIVGILALLSLSVTVPLFLGGELFPSSWLRNPLLQYSLPALSRGQIAPNAGYFLGLRGWESLLPLLLLLLVIGAVGAARRPRPFHVFSKAPAS